MLAKEKPNTSLPWSVHTTHFCLRGGWMDGWMDKETAGDNPNELVVEVPGSQVKFLSEPNRPIGKVNENWKVFGKKIGKISKKK